MGIHQRSCTHTSTGLSPSPARLSNPVRPRMQFLTPRPCGSMDKTHPTTLAPQHLPAITRYEFGLIRFRSPLLSESLLFSLPTGTEMFHFPAFPPHTLYIQVQVTGHNSSQVSPFGHPRINARLPTPQGLSQAPTSFIGSRCQGIHRVPFEACHSQILNKNNKDTLTYKITTPHTTTHRHTRPPGDTLPAATGAGDECEADARVHYPDLKHHEDDPQPHPPRMRRQEAPTRHTTTPPPGPDHQHPNPKERHRKERTPDPRGGRDASDTQQRALPPSTTPTAPRTGHHRAAARGISRRPLVSTTMRRPDTRRPTGVRAP